MRRAIGLSAAVLLLSCFLFRFVFPQANPSHATYNGRTIEDWISNSDGEKEQRDAEIALMMLGEKAVEPLRAILRLKTPNWVVYNWQKIPFGDRILKRPLQNVVKKQRAIECLSAVEFLSEPLLPEIVAIAQDTREFLNLRQIALRHIFRQMPLTADKSNILAQLSVDADLGPEAARYLQSFNRQLRDDEIGKIAEQINDRLDSANTNPSDPFSTTNTLFNQNRPLWENVQ
jgi:hypothetical protein